MRRYLTKKKIQDILIEETKSVKVKADENRSLNDSQSLQERRKRGGAIGVACSPRRHKLVGEKDQRRSTLGPSAIRA